MMGATGDPDAMRMFCLPYAGGSARMFKGWEHRLPDFVEPYAIEIPGRGMRFTEPPCMNLEPLLDDLLDTVLPLLDRPFALFGYSFGALLAFELARVLEQEHYAVAECLVVAAFRSPDSPARPDAASFLSDAEFRLRLRELNGTPRELLENDDLMELMLPTIKADFWVADTHVHRKGPLLSCPVVAFAGEQDPEAPPAEMDGWGRHTGAGFSLQRMPGNHFFVHSVTDRLLSAVSTELRAHRTARTGPGHGPQA